MTDPPAAESALEADDVLERCLELFLPHAPVDRPDRLRAFLPDGERAVAQFVLCELVKLDMAAVAEAGGQPQLEPYAEAFPDLLPIAEAPFDLVIEEYQLRRESGGDPKQAEYARRFPQHAALLEKFSCNAQTVAPTGSTKAPMELEASDTIDDFAILQPLGQGAFARVYLARQQSMQRLVALKVSAGKGDESQALAQFDHTNIVRVFDERLTDDGATQLLYMQYQPGGTLSDVVRRVRSTLPMSRSGELILEAVDFSLLNASQQEPETSTLRAWLAEAPWSVAVAWVGVQLGRALDHAHQHGVLHRDVKPANVLLSAEGVPKLADFNVSFAGSAGRAGAAANLGGSIGYMAPEHLRAIGGLPDTSPADVKEQADVYSLAVLLWELWQGKRPFDCDGVANGWIQALAQQILSRDEPLLEPTRTGESSERVLEGTLRRTLVADPADRPRSGAEFAGRLRLALHPEAADVFDPPEDSWRNTLFGLPTMLVMTAAILGPNIAAGVFNYFYNEREIIRPHGALVGEVLESFAADFATLATTVNAIAFPLGAALLVYFARPTASALRAAAEGKAVPDGAIDSLFALCGRAAWIGGTLWGVASIVYPITLRLWYPSFPLDEAAHFCLSLLVCGGVAAVYPYFLLVVIATAVYYPRLVRRSMTDTKFDERGAQLKRDSGAYLIAAAAIPLLAIALLIGRETMAVDVIRTAVVASIVGLVASFSAYRYLQTLWERMSPVMSPAATSQAPST